MTTVVGLRTEIIHRYVFELRYDFGHVYWDRAGRIAKEIMGLEGWDFEEIDISHCKLSRRDLNLTFNFGPGKLDLSQTQSTEISELMASGEFGAIADTLSAIVAKQLELDSFPRFGFRSWHLYPAGSREESYQFLRNLKLFSPNADIFDSLGDASEISHRLVVERQTHMLRIAVAPFEQAVQLPPSVVRAAKAKAREYRHDKKALVDKFKAERIIQSYPQFGLLVDLDGYVEDPPYPDDLSVSDFISKAVADFAEVKPIVLLSEN